MAQQGDTFDYVIAGGGTAGCVLASRLSADPSVRVLLLEAGRSDWHPFIHVPAGFAKLTAGPYQWGFVSLPQEHCGGREIPLAQGKVLGGGGSINAQVFTRGVAQDYDEWAGAYDCEGWTAKEIQKYFVRSEGNERLSGPLHGSTGPLAVSDLVNPHPLSKAFVRAGQEFGLPYNSDFNGERQHGIGFYQTTTRNSRRCSAAVGYLRPARHRKNLTIKTGPLVRRVILDKDRAVGVEVIEAGTVRQYTAQREVIVASGAFGSPKILQLSGIGDPADLKQAGIATVHALPGVGKNLQDHCDLDIVYELTSYQSMDRYQRPLPATAAAALQYAAFRRGPLASTVVEAGGFGCGNAEDSSPDLQFHFLPAAGVEAGIAAVRPGYGCTLNSYFLRPRSRGTVRVASADPLQAPLIDPNYLADDYDLEMAIEGVRQSRQIMEQPSMAPHIKAEHLAGGQAVETKDDYIAFVRRHGRTAYHPVGTCAMGTSDQAVVSPRLQVHGLRGLRVVDASIMPRIVSSNTQAPTVMIAEKAADLILEDAR
ncbi:GMC family oxidoreductase N-terminal domain-containing protein [Streptomyces sp. RB6PN25]|uniref:GMC family oxidoreductase N-terminal domain-containing protein n=1 Tax=Streptomyces humicola TaxID=2953240 RepID=A0ABT1PT92_9ACTN|nr:GMC family oxidoreductase N-terminal domain-containing protein [Streptomyces humicola]MCQ4080892.1 GMC family oxidoreductase N-terminal domain-containing protein [Streptomyces humicola]